MPVPASFEDAAGLAARAELGWRDRSGQLRAAAFMPLVIKGSVVAALPFSQTPLAHDLRSAATATVVLSDSRMAWRGWRPLTAPARVRVTADRDGDWTWTGALDQEVRKHPPSRYLVDTPIQRREHWWYVPRWIVRLDVVGAPEPVARRAGPDDGVLFEDRSGTPGSSADWPVDAPTARTVAVEEWAAGTVTVTALDGGGWSAGPVRALLFTHDFSVPDQERACAAQVGGRRDGRRLTVEWRDGATALEPLGGVVRRVARHRRLSRACRAALADYDDSEVAAAT